VKSFRLGQRVAVLRNSEGVELGGAVGRVTRLRMGDDLAWVELVNRHTAPGAHPFAEDDPRCKQVCAAPEDCKPARKS
jgi:hypothetical protein